MNQGTVLVVEDDAPLLEALRDTLQMAGYSVLAADSGREALKLIENRHVGIVVSDVQMPHMNGCALLKQLKQTIPEIPVLFMTAYGTIQKAVDAIREGAVDYLVKPFEPEVLISAVDRYMRKSEAAGDGVIAEDARSKELLELARRIAVADATVMITGASGAGKEVVAQFIHRHSQRRDQPFVAINCAAIPENMLEATLFGYEKGAFTGAYQGSPGKFELANGGTLLLDEISEMDLGLQAKLLRVLQEREVERLGARRSISLDVRVIATSNRALRDEVSAGRFREDLFYRLNVLPLHLPLLRERPDDILPLALSFLESGAARRGQPAPILNDTAQQRLLRHNWPGNVRELQNVMERALILCTGPKIGENDLQFEGLGAVPDKSAPSKTRLNDSREESLNEDLRSHEEQLILEALEAGNGSRSAAAAKLGISPRTLRHKLARMRKDGISVPR